MPFDYNISDLLQKAFGLTGSILPVNASGYSGYLSQKINGYTDIPAIKINQQTATSYLGTPIVMPVTFDEVKWHEIENGEKKEKSLPRIQLPSATLLDFSQAKIIEKTRISGRNGTVKEYIGLDDWSIRVRGIIVNELSDTPPEDGIKSIKALKNCPVAIPILNDMCLWLDIYDVTVEDIEFTALEGYPGVQPFTINLSSDLIFELKYKNGL